MPQTALTKFPTRYRASQQGFSLIELAIALLILSLMLAAGLMSLGKQQEALKQRENQRLLSEARDALLGFAITHGRLPCPASQTSNGLESPPGGAACTNPHNGFLPGVTLGLSNLDDHGYALDAWSSTANRLRYSLTTANGNAFSSLNAIRSTGIAALAPDLSICISSNGSNNNSCGISGSNTLSNNAVAVILSLGPNAAQFPGGAGNDEAANLNGDRVFVAAPFRAQGASDGGEFDDQLIWIAPTTLYNRLLLAGQIP